MNLRQKVLILYVTLTLVTLAAVGGWLTHRFQRDQLDNLRRELFTQLKHIDFALTNLISEAENDVAALSANDLVRTREDQEFTLFLEADSETFVYDVGEREQAIIDLFNDLRLTHPYINSVYMGRANGSFVRSHPRAEATRYDPRTRPWYILAHDQAGRILRTAPYPSLTTADVNIGIVTALVDEAGEVYGVVGADVTLIGLTDYFSDLDVGHGGQVLLTDQEGMVLAARDEILRFQSITQLVGESATSLLRDAQGVLSFSTATGEQQLFHYTSPSLGWKIAIVIPETNIRGEIRSTVLPGIAGLLLGLLLLSGLTLVGLSMAVIEPLMSLHRVTRDIAQTGNLEQRVEIKQRDEIGSLAASFNEMVLGIQEAQEELREERDLAQALKDAMAILTSTLDSEIVLDLILEQLGRVVPYEASNIMLIHGDQVHAARWTGYEHFGADSFIAQIAFPLAETRAFREMASSKAPVIVPDVAILEDWQPYTEISWLRSYAAAPIIIRDQVIGFLSVDSSHPDFFDEHHLESLRTFADHAAAAIENARLFEQVQRDATELEERVASATRELRRQAGELTALNELSGALTAHLSVEEVANETYQGITRLMDTRHAHIALYDPEHAQLSPMIRVVDGQMEPPGPPSYREFVEYLIDSRQPLLLPDNVAERAAELGLELSSSGEPLPASWLGVPLIRGGRVLGTIAVFSFGTPGAYQARHRDLLWALANQAAIAINNAQLYSRAEQHATELEILYEVGKEITATLALDAMLQVIVDSAARLVDADKSLLVLLDVEKEQVIEIVGQGYDRAVLEAHTFDELKSGLTGWVLQEKVPTLTNDLQNDPRQRGTALTNVHRSEDLSAAVAPLLIADEILGTLTVVNGPGKQSFEPADLNLVMMLASQAAAAIQKARLYEAAQEADRLKSAFLASMSHELRTPLNSIIGFTGILLQGLVGPLNDEQQKQLGMVMNSARHLLALINDVLDISKIEAGSLDLASECFSIREAIRRAVQTVSPLADRKGLPIIADIAPDVADMVGDQRRMEQILINLINNAVKFTDQGEVRIRGEVSNSTLSIQVIDTGIGIRPEDAIKLFKPFRQIDTGTARLHEGTGLGLAICDRLVNMMGGRIWVESEWGRGSTFAFALPIGGEQ